MSLPLLHLLQSSVATPASAALAAPLLLPLAIPLMVQGALVLLMLVLVPRKARKVTLFLVLGVPLICLLCVLSVLSLAVAVVVACVYSAYVFRSWLEREGVRSCEKMLRALEPCCECLGDCLCSEACCCMMERVFCGFVRLVRRVLVLVYRCCCCFDEAYDRTTVRTKQPRHRWADTGDFGEECNADRDITHSDSDDFEVVVTAPLVDRRT